jgi:L-threonylcarbamoyladenylate synthase
MFEFDFVQEILTTLEKGGLILFPSDTVWAIGCDATNQKAVERVLELKQRKMGKGLVLLASDMKMVGDYVDHIPPRVDMLLVYHTRPLTVIYDESENLPKEVLGPKGSVAIRAVQDEFCKGLIEKLGIPIVATTANIDGQEIPLHFGSISSEILQGVDYVVRYRRDEKKEGELSVIARMGDDGELAFIRE